MPESAADEGQAAAHAEEEGAHPFWPDHVINQVIIFYLIVGLLISLAALVPFELGQAADPLRTPEGIKPEWYFLATYQGLKYFPGKLQLLAMFLASLGGLVLIIWPFVDEALDRRFGRPRLYRVIGTCAVVFISVLGVLGYVSERAYRLDGKVIEFDIKGVPHIQPASGAGPAAPEPLPPPATAPSAPEG
jgi:quinol-cytochrome oxidoreductase complex cytochrome b subunit